MEGIIKVEPIKISGRNVPTIFDKGTFNYVSRYGDTFVVENKTNRNLLLLVRGGGSDGWVKVKKGTGALASQNDMIVEVKSGDGAAVLIESGRFMQMDGKYKGKILIEAKEQETIAVIVFD